MNEIPLQFCNMGLFGSNYIPFISSGFVLFEMVPKVRHVSIIPKNDDPAWRIHFHRGKSIVDNFSEQKHSNCEVWLEKSYPPHLEWTFPSVVKQPAFDEGCRQWPQKRHTYWCICRWSLGHLTKSSSCRLVNKTIKQMLFWTLRLC